VRLPITGRDWPGRLSPLTDMRATSVLGEVDRRGKSLLHAAVEAGSQEVVQCLVENFEDLSLNIKDRRALLLFA